MDTRQRSELADICSATMWSVDMAACSTFGSGGIAEALVEVRGRDELCSLVKWLSQNRINWRVLGGGSNILVATQYYEGVFLRLAGGLSVIEQILSQEDSSQNVGLVKVGGGCSLARFVSWCSRHSLGGLEFMAGIPGSVGGAICMNAGAFDRSVGEVLHSLICVTDQGKIHSLAAADVDFSYRKTSLPGENTEKFIVVEASFILQPEKQAVVEKRCRNIIGERKQKQPYGVGSAGSFFKNPEGDFAGRLIEQAGLKGLSRGRAMVSPKHANFIVNTGGAAPEDILDLMHEVRTRVFHHFGIMLEPEVHIL